MVKVSIIIPTFNNQDTIERALSSVLQQTCTEFEILVIDNGSSDKTISILQELSKRDNRIRILFSHRGRSKARNLGLRMAMGEYIQFLDSDDELSSSFIETLVNILDKNPIYGAVATSATIVNDRTQQTIQKTTYYPYKHSIIGCNPYRINAMMLRNKDNLVLFDEKLEICEDWLFWFENLRDTEVFLDDKNYGAIIHITGHNSSSDYKRMTLYQLYVRGLIKEKSRTSTLRIFLRDLRLTNNFLILNIKDPAYDRFLKKQFRTQFFLLFILYKIPPVKYRLISSQKKEQNHSMY